MNQLQVLAEKMNAFFFSIDLHDTIKAKVGFEYGKHVVIIEGDDTCVAIKDGKRMFMDYHDEDDKGNPKPIPFNNDEEVIEFYKGTYAAYSCIIDTVANDCFRKGYIRNMKVIVDIMERELLEKLN